MKSRNLCSVVFSLSSTAPLILLGAFLTSFYLVSATTFLLATFLVFYSALSLSISVVYSSSSLLRTAMISSLSCLLMKSIRLLINASGTSLGSSEIEFSTLSALSAFLNFSTTALVPRIVSISAVYLSGSSYLSSSFLDWLMVLNEMQKFLKSL